MRRILRKARVGWHRAQARCGCAVPASVRDDLIRLQHRRIGALIPVLYFTIATIAIVAAAASGGGFDPLYHVILPGGFVGMGIYRCLVWFRRKKHPLGLDKIRRQLRSTTWIALVLGLVGGLWTLDAYYDTREARRVLAPVFIFMLTFAAAICLNSLPRAAIGAMLTALVAPTIAMILSVDAGIRAMGISLMIVSWLMIGLILNNFAQMVSSLKLRHKLQQLAESDSLTGLANRRAFNTTFAHMVESGEAGDHVVLTMIDLDGFKQANDDHGHLAGDAILVEVAARLKKICRNAGCIARLGGDEFAVLSASRGDRGFYETQKEAIRAALSLPYPWEGQQIVISASIGMATFPQDGATLSALMKVSDRALYDEKSRVRLAS